MRQTLFYIPSEILGVPLFGVGVLFWIILVVALVSMLRAALKKNRDDFWSYGLVGFLAIVLVVWVIPSVGGGHGFPIRGYGVFLMLAILLASIVTIFRAKKKWNIPPDIIISIVIVQVVCGILGARVFYVTEYFRDFLIRDPDGHLQIVATILEIINLTKGGLVVFGSIIGGVVASLIYLKWKKLPVWGTLDIFSPALMLGIAIGRIGCFMNGCCFGGLCDAVPPGVHFPVASPAHYYQMEHGLASLGGFTLKMPEANPSDAGRDLAGLKKTDRSLMTASAEGPVVIASVEKGSYPEKAGLKEGMTILRMGALFPKMNAAAEEKISESDIKTATMFTIKGTRPLLGFLYEIRFIETKPTLIFDVKSPDSDEIKRIAFEPGPFEVRAVHPTQLYSSASALFLFFLLLYLARFCKRDGVLTALMFILYSVNRFGLEMIRNDESSFLGTGLTVSQCVSLAVAILGVGLFCVFSRSQAAPAYEGMFPPQADEDPRP